MKRSECWLGLLVWLLMLTGCSERAIEKPPAANPPAVQQQPEKPAEKPAVKPLPLEPDPQIALVKPDEPAGKLVCTLRTKIPVEGRCGSLLWSPDGKYLITRNGYAKVQIRDAMTGELVREFTPTVDPAIEASQQNPTCLAIHPNGRLLAVGTEFGVLFYQIPTGEFLQHSSTGFDDTPSLTVNGNKVTSLDFSPDGQLLAGKVASKTVVVWNLKTQTASESSGEFGIEGATSSVVFSPDSKMLGVTGISGESHEITLHNAETLEVIRRVAVVDKRDAGMVGSFDFSPTEKVLVGVSRFELAPRLLNPETGEELRRLEHKLNVGNIVQFSPGGKLIATGGSTLKIWNPATGELIGEYVSELRSMLCLCFAPDGRSIVIQQDDPAREDEERSLQIIDLKTAE